MDYNRHTLETIQSVAVRKSLSDHGVAMYRDASGAMSITVSASQVPWLLPVTAFPQSATCPSSR